MSDENYTNQFKILEEIGKWKIKYATDVENLNRAQKEKGAVKESTSHEQNILEMITSFEKFCLEYVNKLSSLTKAQDSKTPHDWLTSTADYALLEYWEPILRAAEQYQIEHYRNLLNAGYKKLDSFRSKLQEKVSIESKTPIVLYFEKTGKYKRYPFGNIFLIGIPLLDGYSDDWWSMAHELGHHIYWNSSFSENDQSTLLVRGINFFDQGITNSIKTLNAPAAEKKNIRDILEAWTEEIFADVIGAKIVGDEFVEAAWQKMFKRVEKAEGLFVSDKDHPIPYFLPYIRAHAIGRSQLIDDKSKWGRFGDVPPQLANGVRFENLKISLINYVKEINIKLENIRFENWVRNSSALSQLIKFIGISRSEKAEEFIKFLLQPRIIEEGEGWTCRYGHTNNSGVWRCSVCGAWF